MFEAPFVDGSDHRAFSGQLEEYDLDRADRLDRVGASLLVINGVRRMRYEERRMSG
jgi:hypothetical protein